MNQTRLRLEDLRSAFESIPDEVADHGTTPPDPSRVYVVPGHESALNPDTPIVVGDRGTGKSFWSAALNGQATRLVIGRQLKRLKLDQVRVSWGYSSETINERHPSRRVLRKLRDNGCRAEDIWRTVILYQLAESSGNTFFEGASNWVERVQRLVNDPEAEEGLLARLDTELKTIGERHLFVFDALDRLGDNWEEIRPLLQGLLRVGLDLREYRNIRTKFFLRPDMWEDQSIWAFPDASKLTHGRVMLEWRRSDLYGLLWHRLGNDPNAGPVFRLWLDGLGREPFRSVEVDETTVYVVPEPLRTQESAQADLLNTISSPFMGRNRRRGKTYTWLPTHLADAKGQVSPRSFLVALKEAHKITVDQYKDSGLLLHYEGIKRGVQKASDIRFAELREDYPWVRQILEYLRGMTVPASANDLYVRWRENGVVEAIRQDAQDAQEANDLDDNAHPYLPPHGLEAVPFGQNEEDALVEAAIEIGVMSRTTDGRLNVPDLFRVAAGIGRKGGVRAIR